MANTIDPARSSSPTIHLGPSPAIGSIGYYEMFYPTTPPAYDGPSVPPPLSSTRLHPVGPPSEPFPSPPTTPRPFDMTVLRMKMEVEALKIRIRELELKVAALERPPAVEAEAQAEAQAEDEDDLASCDCSECMLGI